MNRREAVRTAKPAARLLQAAGLLAFWSCGACDVVQIQSPNSPVAYQMPLLLSFMS
jgi:hypothetical protein